MQPVDSILEIFYLKRSDLKCFPPAFPVFLPSQTVPDGIEDFACFVDKLPDNDLHSFKSGGISLQFVTQGLGLVAPLAGDVIGGICGEDTNEDSCIIRVMQQFLVENSFEIIQV